jgi:citryl-CoA lyase
MEWKTDISNFTSEESNIRGFNHDELIGKVSFSEMIYILFKGSMPSKEESKMIEAIFVSCIDHGIAVPSIVSARSVASGGNPFNAAVASGILALGDFHGGAIENSAKELKKITNYKETVFNYIENKIFFPGFGHKIYKDFDPRTKKLYALAKELNLAGEYLQLAFNLEKEFKSQKGKKLCLNVDGFIAAMLLDLGFDASLGKAFFIISRIPGICAHVNEELTTEKPFRRVNKEDCIYTGKSLD